jgi:hypothetical protein
MHGGARPGAGRPKKVDEERVRDIALSAIVETHGGEKEAFMWLMNTGEPSLIKFAYEHAFGKPREKQDVSLDFPELKIHWPDGD